MLPFEQKARLGEQQQPQSAHSLLDTYFGARGAGDQEGILTGLAESGYSWEQKCTVSHVFNSKCSLSSFRIPGSMTLTLWCTAWSQLKSADLRLKCIIPCLKSFNFFFSKLVLFGKKDDSRSDYLPNSFPVPFISFPFFASKGISWPVAL